MQRKVTTLNATDMFQQHNAKTSVKKIYIATPSFRSQYFGVYVKSLFKLITVAKWRGVEFAFSEMDTSDIVVSRNYLISDFYLNKPDYDYILFLDADMGFETDLIYDMLALDEPVVGVVYHRRNINLKKLSEARGSSYDESLARSVTFIGKMIRESTHKGFYEVDACGTGVLLISRGCIDTMIEKCPNIVDNKRYKSYPFADQFTSFIRPFNRIVTEDLDMSEDVSFCYRWRVLCGGKILANVDRVIDHVAEFPISTRYSDFLDKNDPAETPA